jgi:chaperone modulatory protein CbpM
MSNELLKLLSGDIMEEEVELTLTELCRACRLSTEEVVELVEYGVIEPRGREPRRWRFSGVSVRRVGRAARLQRDLGINVAGAALVLDLLEEIDRMQARLRRFEGL